MHRGGARWGNGNSKYVRLEQTHGRRPGRADWRVRKKAGQGIMAGELTQRAVVHHAENRTFETCHYLRGPERGCVRRAHFAD